MKNPDNLLLIVAVIAVAVSIAGAMFTYYSVGVFQSMVTGYATTSQSNATVNITVTSNAVINFTVNNIDFGSGSVQETKLAAVMDTSSGTVLNGTGWSATNKNLTLENIGSVNVSLNLRSTANASQFIGGSGGGGPLFQINVTNLESAAGCLNATGFNLGAWYDLTTSATSVCKNFSFLDSKDTIRIDIKLKVPYDANTGALGNTVIATGDQSSSPGG